MGMSTHVTTETNPREPERASSPPAAASATATSAGRGGIAIAVAKVSFILFGFAQQPALSAILGADYADIRRVLAIVSIVNNVIIAIAIQGVSRTVSQADRADAPMAFRRTLVIHAIGGFLVAVAFAVLASPIAALENAAQIAPALRVAAAIVFLYAVYASLIGGLNGAGRFVEQARLDILYGALRFVLVVGGAFVAMRAAHVSGVLGAIVGFVCAAIAILPLAISRSGTGAPGGVRPTTRAHLGFIGPLAFGLIFLNLLLQTDFLLFSHFAGANVTAEQAKSVVNVYASIQLFSFLPYQLLMSVTFVLFPMLARAHAEGDRAAIKRYTETGVRLALLLVGLIASVVAALPYALLRFAFKDPGVAELGARVQPIHALAMAAFAFVGVATTALTSLKRERYAALLTILGVTVVGLACFVFVPRAEAGVPMMVASATATLAGLAITAVVGGAVLQRVARGLTSPLTLLRVTLATGVTVLVGSRLPYFGRLTAPAEVPLVVAAYLTCLLLTRELGGRDLALVRSLVRRR